MSGARDISAFRPFKNGFARDAGDTLRTFKQGFVRDTGNVSRKIFGAFSAKVSPANASGFGRSNSTITVVTSLVTVTPVGGVAPYSYAWTQLTGGSGWSATGSNVTAFRKTEVVTNGEATSTWSCTVTDASGATFTTDNVTAFVQNIGLA